MASVILSMRGVMEFGRKTDRAAIDLRRNGDLQDTFCKAMHACNRTSIDVPEPLMP